MNKELETITPRQLRKILFYADSIMTIGELRKILFAAPEQDREVCVDWGMLPGMLADNREEEGADDESA